MRDEAEARLRRYLRVAYEGGPEPEPPARAPSRWAVPTGAAARIAAVLLVLLVAGVTYLVLARMPAAPAAPAAPSADPAPPATVTETAQEPGATEGTHAVVHVAGAVHEPGLVEMSTGARVAEAIALAGGATEEADLDALNLAAPVVDGQQVYVPAVGEAVPQQSTGGGAPDRGGLININTADADALETLPGIGPALAERIITWRTDNGPFASVDALTNVSGIGPATLARLRDQVTV